MIPPEEAGPESDWSDFVSEARRKIAARKEELEATGRDEPGPDATFPERYDHLVGELVAMLDPLAELEVEPHGERGLRIRFPPTDREVRITSLEEQGFVHFVFGHATLGTLHRAEHHATRPFADRPPDLPKLARQLLAFLTDGLEPRWLTHRPPEEPAPRQERDRDDELELPLE